MINSQARCTHLVNICLHHRDNMNIGDELKRPGTSPIYGNALAFRQFMMASEFLNVFISVISTKRLHFLV